MKKKPELTEKTITEAIIKLENDKRLREIKYHAHRLNELLNPEELDDR